MPPGEHPRESKAVEVAYSLEAKTAFNCWTDGPATAGCPPLPAGDDAAICSTCRKEPYS